MKLKVASTVGQNTSVTVSDSVFGAQVNSSLIAQAIRVYLANQRQGTSKVKTRSEISRSKKKWFKQKGTGNARHGARTPNIFVGGGVAHGPTGLQNWSLRMSSTMKKAALVSALSAQAEKTIICDDIAQLDGKTASAHKMLQKMLPEAKQMLIVLPKSMPMVLRSVRNLPYALVTSAAKLTTFEVASADALVFTKESVKMVEERLGSPSSSEPAVAAVKKPAAPKKVVSKPKKVAKAK